MRNKSSRLIRTLLIGLVLSFLADTTMAQQTCNDETIMNTKGSWKKRADASPFPDSSLPKNQFPQVNNRIDKIQKLLQAAYPDPKGLEAGWYRSISGRAMVKGGPVPYEFQAIFLPYYCNTNRVELMGETDTWFYVFANQFNWFAKQVDYFTVKSQPVYLLTARDGEIGGYSVYKGINNDNSNGGIKHSRTIIIARPGRSPYVPVTHKQYFKAFLLYNEKKLAESLAGIEKGYVIKTDAVEEEEKQKTLEGIAKNTRPEAVERRKADYLKNYKTSKQSKEEFIATTKNRYEAAMKTVRDLLANSTAEELLQPVIVDDVDFSIFKGFNTEANGGRQLVSLNPDYFDTALPKYIPQFLVVYWRWEKNKASGNFKDQLETNFNFNSLKEMLDK